MSNQNSDYDFLKDKGFLVALAIAGFLVIGVVGLVWNGMQ
jgi:hypothetical protein